MNPLNLLKYLALGDCKACTSGLWLQSVVTLHDILYFVDFSLQNTHSDLGKSSVSVSRQPCCETVLLETVKLHDIHIVLMKKLRCY